MTRKRHFLFSFNIVKYDFLDNNCKDMYKNV